MVLVGTRMALRTKTLKCSFYRHPFFLLYRKIYNPLCFLSFSMPCFPTLEINLLDEAVSNHFLRSKKNMSSLTPFSLLNSEKISSRFLCTRPSLFKKKKIKALVTDLSCKHSSVGVDQDICLWISKLEIV